MMLHRPELDAFTQPFGDCALEPLWVMFHLRPNAQIVDYTPIHLDGLLARAVVERATEGRLLPDKGGYWIPLPLKILWQDVTGYPLWAASVLYPAAPNIEDVYVRHKRNSEGWLHDKPRLVTRNGPWMERRLPTPTRVCDTYKARCIGNCKMVQELLSTFTHIGKLRLGRVDSVEVEPAEFGDSATYLEGGSLIRPIPAEANLLQLWPGMPSLIGWTPPFWKPSLFRPGWRAGVSNEPTDWFASASEMAL